jgi:predicted MPP superfamily phosphohydrolase
MIRLKKAIVLVMIFIIIILISSMIIFRRGKYVVPFNFKVTYIDEASEKIHSNFNDVKILFFTDIEYGYLFNGQHITNLKKTINNLDVDIVLFGGDLFDDNYPPVSSDVDILTELLSSVSAPLGKFAILGDFDIISETREILVKKILEDSNFEIVSAEMKLFNNPTGYITLYGDNYGSHTIEQVASDTYSIVLLHGTETYKNLPQNVSLVLSGHSHDRQINFFSKADYKLGKNGNIYRSRGIGLTEFEYRIFSSPEVVVITLKSK